MSEEDEEEEEEERRRRRRKRRNRRKRIMIRTIIRDAVIMVGIHVAQALGSVWRGLQLAVKERRGSS